jgi:hypothetical protein
LPRLEAQGAFRAGLAGRSFGEGLAETGLAEVAESFAGGPNQALALRLQRLPGLTEPRGAFATGRAVRRILALFDQAGAAPAIGEQFLSNLRAAVVIQHMRDERSTWGGTDTVAMFMEMYGRILGSDGADFARVEASLLEDALSDPGRNGAPVGGFLGALRRIRER